MQLDQGICEGTQSDKEFQTAKLLQRKQTGNVRGFQLVPAEKGNAYHRQGLVTKSINLRKSEMAEDSVVRKLKGFWLTYAKYVILSCNIRL